MTGDPLAELLRRLESARALAQSIPVCQPLLINLDDMIGDVVFLVAVTEAESRG